MVMAWKDRRDAGHITGPDRARSSGGFLKELSPSQVRPGEGKCEQTEFQDQCPSQEPGAWHGRAVHKTQRTSEGGASHGVRKSPWHCDRTTSNIKEDYHQYLDH